MKLASIGSLLAKYKNTGILVDSNLLLMYVIGRRSPAMIAKFKRTMTYSAEDFHLMREIISRFSKVITTPNILTEVSNLTSQLPSNVKNDYLNQLRTEVRVFCEEYLVSGEVCEAREFIKLGLTDTAILISAKDKYLIFTADLELYGTALKLGIDAVNLNHLRSANWMGEA